MTDSLHLTRSPGGGGEQLGTVGLAVENLTRRMPSATAPPNENDLSIYLREVSRMRTIQNILITVDLSSSDIAPIVFGIELGLEFGATIHFVAAAPISDKPDNVRPDTETLDLILVDYLVEKVSTALSDQDLLRAVVFHVERAPSRCDAIINYALNNSIDLIVVGSVQQGILRHLIFGGLSDDLLRRAPCPVVRAPLSNQVTGKDRENETDNLEANLPIRSRRSSSHLTMR